MDGTENTEDFPITAVNLNKTFVTSTYQSSLSANPLDESLCCLMHQAHHVVGNH